MNIEVLYSKISKAIVTGANLNYNKGSITIDQDLLDKSKMFEWQKVDVNNKTRKARIVTYIISGERGSGKIELNGAAARYFKKGDEIHINAYCNISIFEANKWKPIIV